MNAKKILDLLSTIWTGLVTHKLRSFLTILGVVIGVAAVIALMSVGQGTQQSILSRLEGLGSNLIFVAPGQSSVPGGQFIVRQGAGSATTLTLEDAQAIAQEVPDLAAVAPSSQTNLQLIYGSQNTRSQVIGTTLDYEQAYGLVVTDGSFFTQDQYDSAQRVAVLGPTVASQLFGTDEPVGQVIRMGNNVATVVGVLASKGQSFGSTDNAVIIPLTTLQQMVVNSLTPNGQHRVNAIVLSATDKKYVDAINAQVTSILQDRHGIDPTDPTISNDFTITTQQDLLNTVTQATNSITLLLGAIAAISLLVGGIGVMNIMLVSVLERTREIGIRKALGAKERDIWIQFLIEAATLTLTGGIAGVIIGWIVAYFIARSGAVPSVVTPSIIILAVSVSVGIGLFFGFYPAWNASRLNPIEALRSE
jgi:putative ABC transport system permease protein